MFRKWSTNDITNVRPPREEVLLQKKNYRTYLVRLILPQLMRMFTMQPASLAGDHYIDVINNSKDSKPASFIQQPVNIFNQLAGCQFVCGIIISSDFSAFVDQGNILGMNKIIFDISRRILHR